MSVRECGLDEVRRAVPKWFEPGAMRFFRSRVGDRLFSGPGGQYFVSSEQFEDSRGNRDRRRYSVRVFRPATGDRPAGVDTAGGFQAFASYQGAIKAARRFAEVGPPEREVES